jgi:hypothetical protein
LSGTNVVFDSRVTSGSNGLALYTSGTTLNLSNPAGGTNPISTGSILSTNAWIHFAVVRSGTGTNQTVLYINGVSQATGTVSGNFSNTAAYIGNSTSNEYLNGYLSNFRVVNGSAVYASAFTPSTTPLTAITNTSLLTCQSNRFLDNSTNAFVLTANGTPSVQAFSPFAPTAAYDTAVVGGSGYFDGSGDYLTAADNAAWDVGSGNWTVETWIYPTASPAQPIIIGQWSGSYSWVMQLSNDSARNLRFLFNDGTIRDIVGTIPLALNAWNHCVSTRDGTTIRLYVNGVQATTYTIGTNSISTSTDSLSVGASNSGTQPFQGYLSSARFVNGTCLYTSGTTFTPPTAPLTAITNTSLLLNYTNSGIYDSTAKNVLETVGNAQVSTTQAKWGTTSMAFDGTGDYLNAGKNEMFSIGSAEDFTFEAWIYAASVSDVSVFGIGSSTFFAYRIISGTPYIYVQTTGGLLNSGTISANTWTHVAISRSSGTMRSFINGTQAASVANTGSFSASAGTGAGVYVGAANITGVSTPAYVFNGYIDDLRFTKGYARYTANFTAPTAAFPLQ